MMSRVHARLPQRCESMVAKLYVQLLWLALAVLHQNSAYSQGLLRFHLLAVKSAVSVVIVVFVWPSSVLTEQISNAVSRFAL